MSGRTRITGTRPTVMWLLVIIVLVLIAGLVVGVFIVYPQYQERQAAQATLEQVETHYQAGVAFQNVGDWEKAAREYEQVIQVKPNYKEVQTLLVQVKAEQAEAQAQATATAVARKTEAAAQAQAEATALAQATAVAQVADATATADALEAHYQKGLAYINLGKWEEAKTELEQVFAADPNYKEVQAKLAEVEAEIQVSKPTATPTSTQSPATPTPPAPTATPVPIGELVAVEADRPWQDTGMVVRKGEKVQITYVSGQWRGAPDAAWNDGARGETPYSRGLMPTVGGGSLIAKVNDGTPVCVGKEVSFVSEYSGILYLCMNDCSGCFGDNSGTLIVQIEIVTQ